MRMDKCHIIGKDYLISQDTLNAQVNMYQLKIGSEEFARTLDQNDPLRNARKEFYYPIHDHLSKSRH
jgi:hypothetical protein